MRLDQPSRPLKFETLEEDPKERPLHMNHTSTRIETADTLPFDWEASR